MSVRAGRAGDRVRGSRAVRVGGAEPCPRRFDNLESHDEPRTYSPEHVEALHRAGFAELDGELCSVTPPAGCRYWSSDTILAPIVVKPAR